jgi:RimJ/RimL family protein N-acetyltransferase
MAGWVAKFDRLGKPEVAYAVAERFRGQGVATAALRALLALHAARPLYARTAATNAASIRVLSRCGFTRAGTGRSVARSGEEIEEILWELGGPTRPS